MAVNDNAIEKEKFSGENPKTFFFVVNFADIDGKKLEVHAKTSCYHRSERE
jgi:hypothetical protein